jgi:hypothetical protein
MDDGDVRGLASRSLIALVALLAIGSCGGDGGGADELTYDCSVFPAAASSPYVLPWRRGQRHFADPHIVRETTIQKYALDLDMPIGTEVIASRAGVVVRVEERYVDGDHTFGHENYVLIEHDDGTVARYVHLTQNGALVALDDEVEQGDLVGYSGNTGNSRGPHLHFDVTESCCAVAPEWNELPGGRTLPLNFNNAVPDSGDLACGLRKNVWYTAQ